jgi:hypothetical protein
MRRFLDEEVGVLRGIGIPQQDGAGFADEQEPDFMPAESVTNFLGLAVFKGAHASQRW